MADVSNISRALLPGYAPGLIANDRGVADPSDHVDFGAPLASQANPTLHGVPKFELSTFFQTASPAGTAQKPTTVPATASAQTTTGVAKPVLADSFLASLPATPLGEAWKSTWTRADNYSQDKIDLPFAYAGTHGMLENNDLYWTVQGMKALGATAPAQGVLENWLNLGERYTALPGTNQLNDLGRSGEPRLSSLLVDAARSCPDPEFRSRAYGVLEGDYRNNWCDTYFKQTPNGLNRFCDVDYSHEATMIESGGEKNSNRYEGDAARFNPVELNAYLYQTEKDLQELAPGDQKQAWGDAAQKRKNEIVDKMWDPQKGFFYDLDWREGTRSDKPCLAAYSLLEVGLLDSSVDKAKVDSMVSKLSAFNDPATGLPSWQPGDGKPASPADIMTVVKGLERYGHADQAKDLQARLKSYLATQPLSDNPGDLGVRTCLEGQNAPLAVQSEQWMSNRGQERLQNLFPGASVGADEAGPVDRRLRDMHPSLLDPKLVKSITDRGLSQAVYGLADGPQGVKVENSLAQTAPEFSGPVELEGLTLQVPAGCQHGVIGKGAVVLSNGDDRLALVHDGDRLIIGDRAYNLKDLAPSGSLHLPQDILQSFDVAGENPQLEKFFDKHREWLPPLQDGPATQVNLGNKKNWNDLYNTIGFNWKELTIDPSVTAKNTASQIFNRAAVPSLGIFKTQFNWDTLFMAEGMKLQGQGETVSGMTDNLLYLLKSTGRVPNAARSVYLNKSQAPVLPGLVRMSAPIRENQKGQQATERWLGSAYDLMKTDYHDFWNRPGQRGVDNIDGHKTTLSRHWGPNDKFAMDESGYDTCSRLDGKALSIVGPDINAFLFKYSQDMGAIAGDLADQAAAKGDKAGEVKYRGEANHWQAESQARKADVIKYCWDEKDGMFRDYNLKTGGLERSEDSLAPMIAPLWVGMLDPNNPKEKVMIDRSFQNLGRFEKEHGIAASAEDYGHPEMQWNSGAWAPLQMMTLGAADRYQRYDDVSRIAGKWVNLVDGVKDKGDGIIERYNPVTGGLPPVQKGRYEETQGKGPGFGWTNGSVAWTMVEMMAGAKADGNRLQLTPHIPKELEGQDLSVDFKNPEGNGQWNIQQNYDSKAGNYDLKVGGDLSHGLQLTTPPLAKGLLPQMTGVKPESYTIRQRDAGDGKVQYHFDFEAQNNNLAVHLGPPKA